MSILSPETIKWLKKVKVFSLVVLYYECIWKVVKSFFGIIVRIFFITFLVRGVQRGSPLWQAKARGWNEFFWGKMYIRASCLLPPLSQDIALIQPVKRNPDQGLKNAIICSQNTIVCTKSTIICFLNLCDLNHRKVSFSC